MDGESIWAERQTQEPWEKFFLQVAANPVRQINQQRDKNGITFARKAKIRTGMSPNLKGLWEESQLFENLQAIITRHHSHFDG